MMSARADAALIGLLLPAMRSGESLHIGGTVTDELLRWVGEHVQGLIRATLPHYTKVEVTADHIEPAGAPGRDVAMGFSGGVDSFAALDQAAGHPSHMQVTYLFLNNVGAHGAGTGARKAFGSHRVRTRELAAQIGLPLVDVDSNLDDHFQLGLSNTAFQNTHTLRNAAVPHLLSGAIGRWYYASTQHLSTIRASPTHDLTVIDAVLLPQLSVRSLQLHSANMDEGRVNKITRIADNPLAQQYLQLCVTPHLAPPGVPNCSRCWKCMGTMLNLDIVGRLDDFRVFDRAVYETHLPEYVVTLLASDDLLDRELVDFAAARGWSWPSSARRRAGVRRARSATVAAARAVKRRLPV